MGIQAPELTTNALLNQLKGGPYEMCAIIQTFWSQMTALCEEKTKMSIF